MKAGRLTALAALTASTLLLAACSAEPGDEAPEMGDAVAEASPPAADPAGRLVELAAGYSAATDLEAAGLYHVRATRGADASIQVSSELLAES